MRTQLLVLLFSVLVSLVSCKCKSFSSDMGNFNPEKVARKDMKACCWYSGNNCCSFNGKVNPVISPKIYQDFTSQATKYNITEECYFTSDFYCYACAPNTASFMSFDSDSKLFKMKLCMSFCHQIWNYCGNTLLRQGVKSESDFCNNEDFQQLLEKFTAADLSSMDLQLVDDSKSDTNNCFKGMDIVTITLTQSTCLPPYTPNVNPFITPLPLPPF